MNLDDGHERGVLLRRHRFAIVEATTVAAAMMTQQPTRRIRA